MFGGDICKEMAEGRELGPFFTPPVSHLRVSPLGIVPKKVSGEFRLIHHLSFPARNFVNDRIPQELYSVCYTSFDTAVRIVHACGWGRS